MLIVLLDHSGSMGDPFAAPGPLSRRTRTANAETKLEAAKEVLQQDIRELAAGHPDMPLAMFAFTSGATLIYRGPVSAEDAVDRALAALRPENGTDIAAALDAAADFKGSLAGTTLTQVVLISDGKSDRVKAMAAARRCLEQNLALSMLLIDPTEEGKAFALDVVRGVGGTYQPVSSRESLHEATKGVTGTHADELARAERSIAAAAEEALSLQQETADRERMKFTAGYPGRISRGLEYPLRVYLHLESQLQEVQVRLSQVRDQFGGYPRTGDAEPIQRIPLGTRLEVTPRIQQVAANPPQQRVTWSGYIEELSFRIHYAGADRTPLPCSGFIDVTSAGLLLAQIPVSIQVETGVDQIEQRTLDMISRVFASYSHKDEPIVRACKATYRALGIQLFVDKDDILSGQVWRDVLRRSIADHDLFQLFWSLPASESDEVANEWRLAKEIVSARTSDFIRPVYWTKPMPPPPEPLKHLHFAALDLDSLRSAVTEPREDSSGPAPAADRTRWREARFPICDTIEAAQDWLPWLQERVGEAVSFLEDLVGVRYFPPITLLVDEQAVQVARRVLTVATPDDTARQSDGSDAASAALEMLQALSLEFHVGGLAHPDSGRPERAAFFGASSDEALREYERVVHMTEWVFAGPAKEFLRGNDTPTSLGNHATFPDYLRALVERWLGYVRVARAKRPGAIIEVGFAVSPPAVELLRRRLPGVELTTRQAERRRESDPPQVLLEMSIESYEQSVVAMWEILAPVLSRGAGGLVGTFVSLTISTHGIYVPASAGGVQAGVARTFSRRGWPEAASYPGQHKVLLCMGSIDRFQAELIESGSDKKDAEALARRFCLSVLVHEHFHAAVATGLDSGGRAALGTEHPERWAVAGGLNESLAAWCERHFFRADPQMLALIDGYIAHGAYPGWPYGGAQVIERFHAAGGVPAVRRWMRHLRDDPENAQQEFDQRAKEEPSLRR